MLSHPHNKKIIFIYIIFIIFLNFFYFTRIQAQNSPIGNTIDNVIKESENSAFELGYNTQSNFYDLRQIILAVVLSFVGIVFLISIIISGFQWMTAAGDVEKVTKSKKRIKNAIIGIAFVFLAYIFTSFIVSIMTSVFTPDATLNQ